MRIRLFNDSDEIVKFRVKSSEFVWLEAVRLCPVWPSLVFCHYFLKMLKILAVGHIEAEWPILDDTDPTAQLTMTGT